MMSAEQVQYDFYNQHYRRVIPSIYHGDCLRVTQKLLDSVSPAAKVKIVASSLPVSAPIDIHIGDRTTVNTQGVSIASQVKVIKETHIAPEKKEDKKKEQDDQNSRILTGIAFTILTLAGSYFLGKSFGEKSDADDALSQIKELRRSYNFSLAEFTPISVIENPLAPGLHHTNLGVLDRTITKAEEVLSQRQSSAGQNLMLRVGFVAMGIIGVLGAVFHIPAAVTISLASVVVLTAASLVKFGYEVATQRSRETRVDDLVRQLDLLKQALTRSPVCFFILPQPVPSAPPVGL